MDLKPRPVNDTAVPRNQYEAKNLPGTEMVETQMQRLRRKLGPEVGSKPLPQVQPQSNAGGSTHHGAKTAAVVIKPSADAYDGCYCPVCGEHAVSRAKCRDGNTICVNQHAFKAGECLAEDGSLRYPDMVVAATEVNYPLSTETPKRYSLQRMDDRYDDTEMVEDPNGEYMKYEDLPWHMLS